MLLSEIKNNPNNPRFIKDEKFASLVLSLRTFPEMMEKRPIVLDNCMPLGGNMRNKAINFIIDNPLPETDAPIWKELRQSRTIPDTWIADASVWSEDQKKEFIIKDNVNFGEWDYTSLMQNWNVKNLTTWGVDLPEWNNNEAKEVSEEVQVIELTPYRRTHVLLSFPPDKMLQLQPLLQQIANFEYVEYEQSSN